MGTVASEDNSVNGAGGGGDGANQNDTTISQPHLIPFLADTFSSIVLPKNTSGQHFNHHQHHRELKKMAKWKNYHHYHESTILPSPTSQGTNPSPQPQQFSFAQDLISNGSVYDINLHNGNFPTLSPTLQTTPSQLFRLELFPTNASLLYTSENGDNLTNGFDKDDDDHHQDHTSMPAEFTELTELNKDCIIVYSLLFVLAAVSNLLVLSCVSRNDRLGKSRTPLLIMNLCIADLIVAFFLFPSEIFWRYTIAWKGGDILCKLCQFIRAFGLYLSSNVVICISIDRYFAIVYPLKLAGAVKRVKWMLVGAWIVSAVSAGPQAFIYHVAQHPTYPEFRQSTFALMSCFFCQCVTKAFLKSDPYNELIYNVSSVAALYFIPLLVIIYTYTMILWKIHQKSKEHQVASQQETAGTEITYNSTPSSNGTGSHFLHPFSGNHNHNQLEVNGYHRRASSFLSRSGSKRARPMLRSSANQSATLSRARSRTLRLTLMILLTFILCYTPYSVLTIWYMLDRSGASQVDERLQEALFIMAVTNSVLNPLIYNSYRRKQDCQKRFNTLLRSHPRISRLLKHLCCCHKKCFERGETNYSETVILTINNRTNNGGRSQGAMSTVKNRHIHLQAPPSPKPSRSQIVTVRRESGFVLRIIRSFSNNNGPTTTLGDNNESLLMENGRDDCTECKVVAVQSHYVNHAVEGSSCSQNSTLV